MKLRVPCSGRANPGEESEHANEDSSLAVWGFVIPANDVHQKLMDRRRAKAAGDEGLPMTAGEWSHNHTLTVIVALLAETVRAMVANFEHGLAEIGDAIMNFVSWLFF